jgi:RecJ-like exonuclease
MEIINKQDCTKYKDLCSVEIEKFKEAWRTGEWSYVTNGKIILRFKDDDIKAREENNTCVESFNWNHDKLTKWIQLDIIVPEAETKVCPECNGKGTVDKCPDCEGEGEHECSECGQDRECETCYGDGKNPKGPVTCNNCNGNGSVRDKLFTVKVDKYTIGGEIVKLLQKLGNTQINTNVESYEAIPFKSDNGVGYFMPMLFTK